MATANTALRVTELDFDGIKNNLKTYLRSQSQFQDFDFEGSGMSVLLDILSYNTHYMGYYLNMVANEMFLDTAQLRNSVLSHAKNLNYFPQSPHGALVKANIIVTPSVTENQDVNVLTLDKYTRFLSQDVNGINYQFVSLYSNTVTKSLDGTFSFANTNLKQGEVITLQYLMDPTNESRRFDIPSSNMDTTTLTVKVQASASNTSVEEYMLAEDITTVSSNSAVYFIEENPDSNYTIYFGDNVIGKQPQDGSVIICNFLNTVGSVANNITRFYLSEPIGGLFKNNVSVTAINSSYGGSDKETIEQVRFRAPYYYSTQNRAVTVQDYQTIITKDYTNIDSVAVWGGEDNDPVIYGKVFMSLKTKGNYYLTNEEKDVIKNNLIAQRNVLTVTPEIIDPDYTYLLIKGQVYYNSGLTSVDGNSLLNYVKAAIQNYNSQELNTFDSTFRKSRLQQYIENCEPSITASDITVYAQKRIPLTLDALTQYNVNYYTSLRKNDYNNRLFTTPEIQITDINNISRNIYFEENPYFDTGISSIVVSNPGINYIGTPTVTIIGDGTGATAKAITNGGQIVAINITNNGTNYTKATVLITGGGGSGAVARAILGTTTGTLRAYYLTSNGNKVVVYPSAGTINYDTGQVILNAFLSQIGTPSNRYYDTDVFTFNAPLEKEIIIPLRNRILTIDMNDPIAIQIDMVAEQ